MIRKDRKLLNPQAYMNSAESPASIVDLGMVVIEA